MSDTPRSDAEGRRHLFVDAEFAEVPIALSRQLERELNAANACVAELEQQIAALKQGREVEMVEYIDTTPKRLGKNYEYSLTCSKCKFVRFGDYSVQDIQESGWNFCPGCGGRIKYEEVK